MNPDPVAVLASFSPEHAPELWNELCKKNHAILIEVFELLEFRFSAYLLPLSLTELNLDLL